MLRRRTHDLSFRCSAIRMPGESHRRDNRWHNVRSVEIGRTTLWIGGLPRERLRMPFTRFGPVSRR